jgi:C4-dicarboxylate-binding protein DctP
VQKQTFALLGAVPLKLDLTEAIAMIKDGTIDAQENPLTNTVTYGVHKFHHFHTLTGHFYISRPIFVHRAAFDTWPHAVQQAMRDAVGAAVAFQREEAIREDVAARAAILAQGCALAELPRQAHEDFVRAVRPLHEEARRGYGKEALALLGE